jgi:hypothetical protein
VRSDDAAAAGSGERGQRIVDSEEVRVTVRRPDGV